MRALSSFFSITLGEPDLKNISLRDMLNLGDVSLHIDCQSKLFFSRFREFCSPTQIQLSLKPTTFSQNFWIFWNLYQFLNILEKMMIIIGRLFRKLQTVRDLVRPLSKKHRFRTPLDSQHVKGFQTLIKSA